MRILKLTSYDRTRKDRALWVNFDYVIRIKNRHNAMGEKIGGAEINLVNDMDIAVTESAEDIIKALSIMDNKDYNKGVNE